MKSRVYIVVAAVLALNHLNIARSYAQGSAAGVGLEVKSVSGTLLFTSDMKVREIGSNGETCRETTWAAFSSGNLNYFSYCFPGLACESLPVNYSFSNTPGTLNRLVVKAADSEPWYVPGSIQIENGLVRYPLINRTGLESGQEITFPAEFSVDGNSSRLKVTSLDGAESYVLGNDGASVVTEEYFSGGDSSRDLLSLKAATENTIEGNTTKTNAEISLVGYWEFGTAEEGVPLKLVTTTERNASHSVPVLGRLAIKDPKVLQVLNLKDESGFEIDLGRERLGHSPSGARIKIVPDVLVAAPKKVARKKGFWDRIGATKDGRLTFTVFEWHLYWGPGGLMKELP